MKIIRKRIVSLCLVLLTLFSSLTPAFAEETGGINDQIAFLENELAENRQNTEISAKDLEEINQELDAITEMIAALDDEIHACSEKVAAAQEKTVSQKKKCVEAERKLKEAKKQQEDHLNAFKERLRAMYESGVAELGSKALLLTSIFSGKNLTEAINMVGYCKDMSDYDEEMQIALSQDVEHVNAVLQILEREEKNYERDLTTLEAEKRTLEEMREKKLEIQQELLTNQRYTQIYLERLKKESADLKAKIASYKKKQQNAVYSAGWTWPVPGCTYIASYYGSRIHPIYGYEIFHDGVDIASPEGAAIVAAAYGTVTEAGWGGGYGNYVVIQHPNGLCSLYAHCSSLLVYCGQTVSAGQTIALVGMTGSATGPHCHFEVLSGGSTLNPLNYI